MIDRIHKNRNYRNLPFELQIHRHANFLDFDAPKPSKQEVELQQKTLDALNRAEREGLAMKPFILQSMGLKEDVSPENVERWKVVDTRLREIKKANIEGTMTEEMGREFDSLLEESHGLITTRKLTEEETLSGMSALERKQYDITSLEYERQEKALKGELPLSEGTVQRRTEETKQFESEMSRRLGPSWRTSTPGIQAQKEFESRWGLMEEAERTGQMQRGTGAIATQTGLLKGTQAQQVGQMTGFPQRNLGLLSAYGQAQQPYQYQRGLESQHKAGLLQDIGSTVGLTGYGLAKKYL